MQPSVKVTIGDGALGILAPSDGNLLVVAGSASTGPMNSPSAYARLADIQSVYTSGPGVEASGLILQLTGLPVVFDRMTTTTAATTTTIDTTDFLGTATPSIDVATEADDNYEVEIQFITGGTLGVAGITYVTSLDGGRTLSPVAKLGTAASITIPTPGGLIKVNFASNDTALVTLANDLRTQVLAHFPYTVGNVHLHSDTTSDDGIGAAATDEASAIVLLNQIRAGYELHRVNVGAGLSQVHLAADTVNVIAAPVATDGPSAVTLANDIRAKFIAHEASTIAHTIADAAHAVTAPVVAATSVIADDVVTFRAYSAAPTNGDLPATFAALKASAQPWNIVLFADVASAAMVEAVDGFMIELSAKNKFRYAIMNVRLPDIGESDAAYQAALAAAFGAIATKWVDLSAGSCKLISSVTGRQYRRPVAWIDAVRALQIDAGQALAEVRVGPLPSCSITDANGNPDDHDESVFPGLDDQRFTTLRSIDGFPGVYINIGRIFAPTGSDFDRVQLRRVMNLAATALVRYLVQRLSIEIFVDPATGFISKASAADLNAGGTAAMGNALFPKKRASDCSYVVSETDNILSTRTITGQARIVPNGYAETFVVDIAFENPALKLATAA